MAEIHGTLNRLIKYGLENELIVDYDEIWVRNELMDLFHLTEWKEMPISACMMPKYPQSILDTLCDYAVEQGIIEDTAGNRELFDTKIMGKLTPSPSQVIDRFRETSEFSKEVATRKFYEFSQKTNYIRMDRIAKNVYWQVPTEYGDLEITINLSKPEKDPRDIERQKNIPSSSYPKCLLCYENVGYAGMGNHPARQNHRVLPFVLEEEKWYLQYSPYVYYNEHAIVFSREHRPMKISRDSFARITAFLEQIPHYFLGSNADLPIVGGSILSHDHYQGGNHEFPMAKAEIEEEVVFKGFEKVKAGIVKWPMSVLRISSPNREAIINLSDKILKIWREYSDENCGIYAYTGEEPHNTITPIGRRRGEAFEMDLVLRNNRRSEAHPLGIFHPHEVYHNIKKENIGLIEVMGLAVLPGRLKEELEILQEYLQEEKYLEKIKMDERVQKHYAWIASFPNSEIDLEKEVGRVFVHVLEDAGVYKRTEEGRRGLLRFVEAVNEN
ncbi:UDP-glucose--hexose-1-phosphate uridylyltransferase [Fusobacterium necrophorum subsp. funduliforme]